MIHGKLSETLMLTVLMIFQVASAGPDMSWVTYSRDRVLAPQSWQEDWSYPEQFFPKYFSGGAFVRAIIEVDSQKAPTISSLQFDNHDFNKLLKGYIISWYRSTPVFCNGKWVFIVEMRFYAGVANGDHVITVKLGDGKIAKAAFCATQKSISLEYVQYDRTSGILNGYLRRDNSNQIKVEAMLLDNRNILEQTIFLPGMWYGDIAPFRIVLTEELQPGSIHFLNIKTNEGEICADFKAWDVPFQVGIYGGTGTEQVKISAELGFNNILCYNPQVTKDIFDNLRDNGIYLIGRCIKEGSQEARDLVRTHPAVSAIYTWDEPDVKDYRLNNRPFGKRVGGHGPNVVKDLQATHEYAPERLSYLVVDSTFKPANWYTYGQISDLFAVDPYWTVMEKNPKESLYKSVETVCRIGWMASRPKPLFVTLQAHFFNNAEHKGRMLTADETRACLYYALGNGAKGINYFSLTFGQGKGLIDYPELYSTFKELNELCVRYGDFFRSSVPVDGVIKKTTKGLYARALVAPSGSIMLVLVAKPGENLQNIEIILDKPEWFKSSKVISCDARCTPSMQTTLKTVRILAPALNTGALLMLTNE